MHRKEYQLHSSTYYNPKAHVKICEWATTLTFRHRYIQEDVFCGYNWVYIPGILRWINDILHRINWNSLLLFTKYNNFCTGYFSQGFRHNFRHSGFLSSSHNPHKESDNKDSSSVYPWVSLMRLSRLSVELSTKRVWRALHMLIIHVTSTFLVLFYFLTHLNFFRLIPLSITGSLLINEKQCKEEKLLRICCHFPLNLLLIRYSVQDLDVMTLREHISKNMNSVLRVTRCLHSE